VKEKVRKMCKYSAIVIDPISWRAFKVYYPFNWRLPNGRFRWLAKINISNVSRHFYFCVHISLYKFVLLTSPSSIYLKRRFHNVENNKDTNLITLSLAFVQIVEPHGVHPILDDLHVLQVGQGESTGDDLGVVGALGDQLVLQILHHLLHAEDDHEVVIFDIELPEIPAEEPRLLGNPVAQGSQARVVDQPWIQLHAVCF